MDPDKEDTYDKLISTVEEYVMDECFPMPPWRQSNVVLDILNDIEDRIKEAKKHFKTVN